MSVPRCDLQVTLEVKDLARADGLSKNDPFVVMYVKDGNSAFREIGRTERVKNVQACKFTTVLNVSYFFEMEQKLKFDVYDSDAEGERDLSKHDFIGRVEVRLGEIVGLHQGVFTSTLKKDGKSKKKGTIIVTVEEDRHARGDVSCRFSGIKLDKKDTFGKSDPYFIIFRKAVAKNDWEEVFRSKVIKNTLNPVWEPFTVSTASFCNGDFQRPMKIEVYDWDATSAPDLIGIAETTLAYMLENNSTEMELINPKKKEKKKKYKNSGTFRIDLCKNIVLPSFLDYLQDGFQLDFTVAIDFTASNGKPTLPSSLHFMNPAQPNEYIQAISAVGNIISDYDTDKWFPGFGFGLKFKGSVSFIHPLNGNMSAPFCQGTQGLVDAYRACLYNIELWGPTNMAPMINHIASMAKGNIGNKKYSVLLIITDGEISDLGATKSAIIEASGLPMSIIIIGVGSANFDAMDALDSDNAALEHAGKRAQRDIVQFVPFRHFAGDTAKLASSVLAEVPGQFMEYMKNNNIQPSHIQ
eukprot:m.137110 g.137110  ORF g.137110 m.137110 type:complete len:524 (-) comp11269_c0_seq1:136-1707(-)